MTLKIERGRSGTVNMLSFKDLRIAGLHVFSNDNKAEKRCMYDKTNREICRWFLYLYKQKYF